MELNFKENVNGDWQTVILEDEDINNIVKEIVNKNIEIYKEIYYEIKKIEQKHEIFIPKEIIEIIFDKASISLFTSLKSFSTKQSDILSEKNIYKDKDSIKIDEIDRSKREYLLEDEIIKSEDLKNENKNEIEDNM